jgi:signal peptidase I
LGWIALAIATCLAPQILRAYVMPTGSMEDTLLIGDQLLVRVWGASTPSRGDAIVFRYPVDIRMTHVKRCMGVPGDRIKVVNKQLYLNGKKLDEPYAYHKTEYVDAYRDNFPSEPNVHLFAPGQDMLEHHVVNGEVVVPPDSYFAMGDNRDASLDSRYWGFVPRANLVGTPWIVYWSYAAPTEALAGPASGIGQIVDRYQGFFSKTRWNRLFRVVRGYAAN